MNAFHYPDAYQVCFAGVPVSDLILRTGYQDDYGRNFRPDYHIGKSMHEDIAEYQRRSPAWNAEKLKIPLLIHANTNDDDVSSFEVKYLVRALEEAKKKFEYEIYEDVEGGHMFDRMDTKIGKEIRLKIYHFLSRHLDPPRPLKSVDDMHKAAYRPVPE